MSPRGFDDAEQSKSQRAACLGNNKTHVRVPNVTGGGTVIHFKDLVTALKQNFYQVLVFYLSIRAGAFYD